MSRTPSSSKFSASKTPIKRAPASDSEIEDTKPNVRPRRDLQTTTQPLQNRPVVPQGSQTPANNPPPALATKHNQFYYADGSVVLLTTKKRDDGDGNPPALFRVSKSQLETHSPILKELLAELFENPDKEMHEGCPVLRVPFSTAELEALFKVLWGGPVVNMDGLTSDFVISVLRIASNWQMEPLRKWSLTFLSSKIPITFNQFLKDSMLGVFDDWIAPSKVIQLRTELNIPRQMAAIALYYLSTVNWAVQPKEVRGHLLTSSGDAGLETKAATIEKVVVGRERTRDKCLEFFYTNPALPGLEAVPCVMAINPGGTRCMSKELRTVRGTVDVIRSLLSYPLECMKTLPDTYRLILCKACHAKVTISSSKFSESLFAELPTLFELSPDL